MIQINGGDGIFGIKLDKTEDIPVYRQLGDTICGMITDGALVAGQKLPPIRKLARALNVNNVTVVNAYRYLESKKAAYARVGSGTFVAELLPDEQPKPIADGDYHIKKSMAFELVDAINFASSSTSKELFPIAEFKELLNHVIDRDKAGAFSYTDSQGYEPLREAVCGYLDGFGIRADSEKIQIISGAQQGIDIVAKAMLSVGDVLFVEKPTYYGAIGAFLSRGAQVIEVEMAKDGMDIDRLRALLKLYRPKFIYVMTYFQTPTCGSYSMEKKRSLLELAAEFDTYIIEEDNQSEFQYAERGVVPLKALDHRNRVIYIKSFSKILMPGLRLGFMVLPLKILRHVMSAKYISDIYTSGFTQRAFELYLKSDGWTRHTTMMRHTFKKRYEDFIRLIDAELRPFVKYNKPGGGLSLWLGLKNKELSATEVCGRLLNKRVVATPGAVFSTAGEDLPYIRLSFADVKQKELREGVGIIAGTLREIT